MPLWGFWAYAIALSQHALSQHALSQHGPSHVHVMLGVGLFAAVALLLVAAVCLPVLAPSTAPGFRAFARRARVAGRPRLDDPDAPGRPRPRAPGLFPAVA
jgi:hypothetical protein